MTTPRLRWAVRTCAWAPSPTEVDFLLACCGPEQAALVLRHSRTEDRRRALAARLLERAAAAAALGLPLAEVRLRRTRGGKPYVANEVPKPHAPNWNFSVSHEGDYVILASEPVAVVGCDVAAPQAVRRPTAEPPDRFFRAFERQFSRREWGEIRGAGGDAAQEAAFRMRWSLKEAFVKATGEGLGFDLGLLEFSLHGKTASVSVRGEPADGWVFHLHELGFRATFQKTQLSPGEWAEQLAAPEPAFSLLGLADLLSPEERAGYEEAGGELL